MVRNTIGASGLTRKRASGSTRCCAQMAATLIPRRSGAQTEDDAYDLFVDFRWADNGGEPNCPRCGCRGPYSIRRRAFAARTRMPGRVLRHLRNGVRQQEAVVQEDRHGDLGVDYVRQRMAALHLTRKINTQYKTPTSASEDAGSRGIATAGHSCSTVSSSRRQSMSAGAAASQQEGRAQGWAQEGEPERQAHVRLGAT